MKRVKGFCGSLDAEEKYINVELMLVLKIALLWCSDHVNKCYDLRVKRQKGEGVEGEIERNAMHNTCLLPN